MRPRLVLEGRLRGIFFLFVLNSRLPDLNLLSPPRHANISTPRFNCHKGGVWQGETMFSKTGNFSSLLGLPAQIKRRQKTSVPTPRPHLASHRCFLCLIDALK